MIDRLTNCPQCGGILNEAGRCEFCGSKVYDFLNISFEDRYMPSANTYIRVKHGGKILLAPVTIDHIGVNYAAVPAPNILGMPSYYLNLPCYPTMDVSFRVMGT